MANDEQRESWNGESGAVWTERQEQFDRMLEPWVEVLAGAAQIRSGEQVLDLGCGTGTTTLEAAWLCGPSGTAVGVDLSVPMVERARERAMEAELANIRFEVGDCQVDELPDQPYDVAISRFGVMFFDDPVAAFANVGRAMAPGGRLAMLTWAPLVQQDWITVLAAGALQHLPMPDLGEEGGPGMFSLADRERIVTILEAAGWSEVDVQERPKTVLVAGGGSTDRTLDFLLATGLGRALMAEAPDEATADKATDAMRTALEGHKTPRGVELGAVALTVTATHT